MFINSEYCVTKSRAKNDVHPYHSDDIIYWQRVCLCMSITAVGSELYISVHKGDQ